MRGRRDVCVEALFTVKGYTAADVHFGIWMMEMEMEVDVEVEVEVAKRLELEVGGGK